MPSTQQPAASFNVKLIHALLQLVQHQGIGVEQALIGSTIEQSSIDTPGQRHSIDAFEALLSSLIKSTGNTKLAIQAAQATEPRTLGCLGFIMSTANTLQDAYQMLADYFSLVYEGIHLNINHQQQYCELHLELSQDSPVVIEFFIACLLNWPRWLTGRTIPAQSVHFNFQGNSEQQHYRQLATEVKFSQNKALILINSQYMRLNCLEANPEMHQLHCQYADSLQLKSTHQQAIIAQTKHQIRQLIQAPKSTDAIAIRREQVADNLNLSLRTFQRKLSELDTSFQSIYDTVRHETCIQLMTQPTLNFGQIAYKLGFSNLSAFQKAFKRWMNTSPSQYRKQLIKPTELPKNHPIKHNISWYSKLNNRQLNTQIAKRVEKLSHFSQYLLALCALTEQIIQSATPIEKLAQISGSTIARLSIYLWPAQQQQLIASTDKTESAEILIEFSPLEVAPEISKTLSPQQSTEIHFKIANFYQVQNLHTLSLKHFELCHANLLEPKQINQLQSYCSKLLSLPDQPLTPLMLNKVYALFIKCKKRSDSDIYALNNLQIDQLSLWIKLAYFDAAHQQLKYLQKQSLSQQQSIDLSSIAADLLIELNQIDKALILLLDTALHQCQLNNLIKDDNQVLLSISKQLEVINETPLTNSELCDKNRNQLPSRASSQLKILLRIIQTYLQAHQPLQAAGTIVKMLKLCIKHSDNYYSAFACAHFSWVCCWYSGNINAARVFANKALDLASQHSVSHLHECELILKQKLYHWLQPIQSLTLVTYPQTNTPINPIDKSLVQSLVIALQLKFCCGKPLREVVSECLSILEQFNPGSHQLARKTIQNIVDACQMLYLPKISQDKHSVAYIDSERAFSKLFCAFYSFDHAKWPAMQNWDLRLESEITSEYIATEAVFICTIMRLHCFKKTTKTQIHASQQARFDAQISRLKLWQTLSPENFSVQHQLALAIYHSIFSNNQTAISQFETAFNSLERFGHTHHKIVYYHYYSLILETKSPVLSLLCSDKKNALQDDWTTKHS